MRYFLVILTLLLPMLTACGGAATPNGNGADPVSSGEATQAPASEATQTAPSENDGQVDRSQLADELFVFTWSDYIDPAIVEDFEQEYGVQVTIDLYDSNEIMIPRIRAGNSGYDVVVPTDYAVKIMVQDGLLAPLDKSLLPNLEHIDPTHLSLYFDPENAYTVPYFWGTTGIAYNTTVFDTPPDSWAMLFEADNLETIAGRFTMLEDPRETPGAALIYQGNSVNTTDPAALAAVEELLIAQKPSLTAYDSANVNLRLATEEIVIAHAWSGIAAQAIVGVDDKPGNPNIAYLIPQEGGVIWQDNLAVVADSPNQYTAHVFIDYLLRPDIAVRNTDWVLYLTPNQSARELLSDETKKLFATGIEPDDETIERLQWIERDEQTDIAFADLWTRVTGQ
ncbi:MAG: spermidine/putrescine ABC transporter substrate-binding protein [Chloroflexales bacterium]|nr:spermidine/putrescine ABC transporter substrate-binding protein [Chloroflexales bacterium]